MLKGKGISRGIGIGNAKLLKKEKVEITDFKVENKENELKYFKKCLEEVIEDTKNVIEKLSGTEADIVNAYLMLLQDENLYKETEKLIKEDGYNSAYATKIGFEGVENIFKNMDDEYMKERFSDIEDMKKRVINKIANIAELDLSNLPENTILVGKDISTSDTAKLNLKNIVGIIIENGSENSHVSIMARTHEIPAIVGAKDILKEINENNKLAINGETGEIYNNLTQEQIDELKNLQKKLMEEL